MTDSTKLFKVLDKSTDDQGDVVLVVEFNKFNVLTVDGSTRTSHTQHKVPVSLPKGVKDAEAYIYEIGQEWGLL